MGWSVGYDDNWMRDIGYGVPSMCDHPGCTKEIHRGLSYVCGGDAYGGEHGCGLFFCNDHLQYAGKRRDNVQLCSRCYAGKGLQFTPTPDRPEWVRHKLTDPSWTHWRTNNADEVQRMIESIKGSS